MFVRRLALGVLALALPATATVALLARNDVGEVAFPANFSAGVLYATVDRADIRQYLELFAPPEAIAAAKHGEPLPDGTVLTLLKFNVRRDAGGNPLRDANGRFVKAALLGYAVMEKRHGWGAELPPTLRNGDWKYRAFTAGGAIDGNADPTACLQCHKRQDKQDFVFSRAQMKAAE
jgi:hypothetical protein